MKVWELQVIMLGTDNAFSALLSINENSVEISVIAGKTAIS
jgi:hypothetical protein